MIKVKGNRFIEIEDFGWIDLTKIIRVGPVKKISKLIVALTGEDPNKENFTIETANRYYSIEEEQIKREEFVKLWFESQILFKD